jgi:hypothetical protein
MKTRFTILAGGIAAVAITAGIGVGIAAADTPSPSPTPTASPTTTSDPTPGADRTANKKHRTLRQRAIHGEFTMGGPQHRVVDFQRGVVEKVSATSITVKSTDGFTATYVVSADTRVRKDQEKATIAAVEVADKVGVVAIKDGSTVTAKAIGARG